MPTRQIQKGEGGFWIAFGVFVCVLGSRIQIGTLREPGPAFFALIAGFSLIVLGTLMLLWKTVPKAQTDSHTHHVSLVHSFFKWRLVATMALLLAYAFLLNVLGFIICTFLAMWALFYDWGKNRLFNAFLASLLTTGVTYFIFVIWLQSPLPRGFFPWW